MADDALGPAHPLPSMRRQVVPSGVLGMIIFIIAESMFFAGLISAFIIIKAGTIGGWPPANQPRLPVEMTAINTTALLLSAVTLWLSNRAFRSQNMLTAKSWLALTIALGGFFVAFQGAEWVGLIRQGLTVTSSSLGSFFYLIIGSHALHAIVALLVLGYTFAQLRKGSLDRYTYLPAQLFWYFVVLLWPMLYWKVYF
ncbi:MAG: heme-copper oxidase subunit III [Polyangiales bacterium]